MLRTINEARSFEFALDKKHQSPSGRKFIIKSRSRFPLKGFPAVESEPKQLAEIDVLSHSYSNKYFNDTQETVGS